MNTQQASEFISNEPTSDSNAIAKLQSIAALSEYGKVVDQDFTEKSNGFTFKLFHNYPNPFNSYTVIIFLLFETGNVRIQIFNTSGENIKSFDFGSLSRRSSFLSLGWVWENGYSSSRWGLYISN